MFPYSSSKITPLPLLMPTRKWILLPPARLFVPFHLLFYTASPVLKQLLCTGYSCKQMKQHLNTGRHYHSKIWYHIFSTHLSQIYHAISALYRQDTLSYYCFSIITYFIQGMYLCPVSDMSLSCLPINLRHHRNRLLSLYIDA